MRRPDEIFPHRNRPNLLHLLRLRIVLAVVPTRVADGNVQSVAQQFAGLLYVGPHVTLPGGPQEQFSADYLWCGRGDLNPHASRRHPLKVVCLPIPPLPHGATTVFAGGAKNAVVAKQDCFCDKLLSRRTAFAVEGKHRRCQRGLLSPLTKRPLRWSAKLNDYNKRERRHWPGPVGAGRGAPRR